MGRAIAVIVTCDNRARILELNLVEPNISSHVLEAIRPEIPEQPHFTLTLFGFTDGDQIDPAVVVVVDGGDAIGTNPVRLRKFHLVERFTVVVAPERKAGCFRVRKSQVHPAIMVEVENGDTYCRTPSPKLSLTES